MGRDGTVRVKAMSSSSVSAGVSASNARLQAQRRSLHIRKRRPTVALLNSGGRGRAEGVMPLRPLAFLQSRNTLSHFHLSNSTVSAATDAAGRVSTVSSSTASASSVGVTAYGFSKVLQVAASA